MDSVVSYFVWFLMSTVGVACMCAAYSTIGTTSLLAVMAGNNF